MHGIENYFKERKRNQRRLAAMSVAVGLALLAPLVVLLTTPLGTAVRESHFMRFGVAGPPRYVELVQIDARPMNLTKPVDIGHVVVRSGLAGAPGPRARRSVAGENPRPRQLPGDAGQGGHDLLERAMASRGQVPMFQSSELVIEELIRPEYPEEAREHGIEGHVGVLARVDTLGRVVEAEVINPSGEPQLDVASRSAVMRCRFRPYQEKGKTTEVYAVFRFAFRIY